MPRDCRQLRRVNWDFHHQDLELLDYLKYLIKLRKKLINIINPPFLQSTKITEETPKYYWHGAKLDTPDWSSWSHTIAFSINKGKNNPLIWTGLNAYSKNIDFCLPKSKSNWLKVIDTSMPDIFEPYYINEQSIEIKSRSSVLIISDEVFRTKNNIL